MEIILDHREAKLIEIFERDYTNIYTQFKPNLSYISPENQYYSDDINYDYLIIKTRIILLKNIRGMVTGL